MSVFYRNNKLISQFFAFRKPVPVQACILDFSGTTCDIGVWAPTVAFIETFKKEGVPISVSDARLPMGVHKKVHIQKITEIPKVKADWIKKFGKAPTSVDVDRMFKNFVPIQLNCLPRYTALIEGTVPTVSWMRNKGIKIGSTTGFTRDMVDILLKSAAKQGYIPDSCVAADEVPQARPFPFMVWKNAINLNVSPREAIVKVDDTVDGVTEGVEAGTWAVGLAKKGNYMARTEEELQELEKNNPKLYTEELAHAYNKLISAGAHYVVDDIASLPKVIDDINKFAKK